MFENTYCFNLSHLKEIRFFFRDYVYNVKILLLKRRLVAYSANLARNNFEVVGKNCKTYRMSLLNNVQKSVKSFKITMVIKVSPLSQFSHRDWSQQRQMIFINIIWNISSFL